jgi:hypothetical protein
VHSQRFASCTFEMLEQARKAWGAYYAVFRDGGAALDCVPFEDTGMRDGATVLLAAPPTLSIEKQARGSPDSLSRKTLINNSS